MATDEISFQSIGFATNFTSRNVQLTRVTGPAGFQAVVFQCKMNEDFDGAPTAYAPPGSGLPMLETSLANATSNPGALFHSHDFEWVGVFAATQALANAHHLVIDARPTLEDRNHRFPVQQTGPPGHGFYVSTSATAADPSRPEWDQQRYWDASAIPYCALTPPLIHQRVDFGDFGLAIRNGTGVSQGFFFADRGNGNRVGECSTNLVRALGLHPNNDHGVSFLVFPGSGSGPRPTLGQIRAAIKIQIATLALASNAERLPMFLASGADLRFLENIVNAEKAWNFRTGEYGNVMRALREWGYRPTMGDFSAQQQPA